MCCRSVAREMCCAKNKVVVVFAAVVVVGVIAAVDCQESVGPLRKLLQTNTHYNSPYNKNYNNRNFNVMFNRCNNQQKEWMTQCEIDAAEDWDIAQYPNVSQIWDQKNPASYFQAFQPGFNYLC